MSVLTTKYTVFLKSSTTVFSYYGAKINKEKLHVCSLTKNKKYLSSVDLAV